MEHLGTHSSWSGIASSLDSPTLGGGAMFSPPIRRALQPVTPASQTANANSPAFPMHGVAVGNTPRALKATKVKYSPPKEAGDAMLWESFEQALPLGYPHSPQTPMVNDEHNADNADSTDKATEAVWEYWEGMNFPQADARIQMDDVEERRMEIVRGVGLFFAYLLIVAFTAAYIFFPPTAQQQHSSLSAVADRRACISREDCVRHFSLVDEIWTF